jgi:nitroimidazol reductase NimA-like FMN-containing flavoprotein (pyridoxamine 5'-phosphate oxidase superfamily)
MLGKLNNTEIEEVLQGQFLGRIGCSANGLTYITPVSYAYDGKYIYVRSKSGMKADIIRENPQICFEVEAYVNMANWRTVIAWGKCEEITLPEEREHALKTLLHRHLPSVVSETVQFTPHWPFKPTDINSIEGIVYRIDFKEKTGRFENTAVEHQF